MKYFNYFSHHRPLLGYNDHINEPFDISHLDIKKEHQRPIIYI